MGLLLDKKSGGGAGEMLRLPLVEETDPDTGVRIVVGTAAQVGPDEYVEPATGIRMQVELTGISRPFMLPNKFYNPNERGSKPEQEKARFEFMVLNAKGNAGQMIKGKRFSVLYTWSLDDKAHLNHFFSALDPQFYGPGFSPWKYIGTTFVGVTEGQQNDRTKFARISAGSIESDSVSLPQAVLDRAKQPTLAGVGAAADAGWDDEAFPE